MLRQGKLRLGTTDAYFLDRLAGRFVTDISTASRTSLLNLESGEWDDELCELFKVPRQALPEIVATTGDLGSIESQGRRIPVTASVVDQQASLYGHGCRNIGDAKITFGTGAFALVITGDQPQRSPEQGLLPTVAWETVPGKPMYALDGGVYCAGSAVEWARKLGLFDDYAEINQFSGASAIERDLVFVPALSGLACPHWDRRAAGLWLGLSLETERADLVRNPEAVVQRIYDFLGIPELAVWGDGQGHYFDRIEKEITENDGSAYGIPDLHQLGPKLRDRHWKAKDVLGNQLYFKYKRMEFWRPKKRNF